MEAKRALIFVNGRLPGLKPIRALIQPADTLIAVDGGARHLQALGLLPHLLVGDLDSIPASLLQEYQARGVQIRRFPPAKDETDLELAVQIALQEGCTGIRFVAALGGRLDHTLGNLFLLSSPHLKGLDVRLDDGRVEVFLIRDEVILTGAPGDLVSLLPLGGQVEGVTTRALEYPLLEATLFPEKTRGISNVMLSSHAGVKIRSGLLICVHTRVKNGTVAKLKKNHTI